LSILVIRVFPRLVSFPRKREPIISGLWNMGPHRMSAVADMRAQTGADLGQIRDRLRGDDNRQERIDRLGMTAG
jgi:hypothetical protein